jgi:hypothetical protein
VKTIRERADQPGIVQDEEPLLDDARTTFIELVPAEKEIRAPIELTRRSCGPVIRVSAPDLDATGNSIRERTNNTAGQLREAAVGYGAFADPKQTDLVSQ